MTDRSLVSDQSSFLSCPPSADEAVGEIDRGIEGLREVKRGIERDREKVLRHLSVPS